MSRWLPGFGVPVLGLLLLPIGACDGTTIDSNPAGPTPLNATADVRTTFDFVPATLRAEALPGSCGSQSPFGVRLGVNVRGDDDVIVTSLKFSYFDRRGSQGFPTVIPIPDLSTTAYPFSDIPSSSAIPIPGVAPLPTASAIPIPGGPPSPSPQNETQPPPPEHEHDAQERQRLGLHLRRGVHELQQLRREKIAQRRENP